MTVPSKRTLPEAQDDYPLAQGGDIVGLVGGDDDGGALPGSPQHIAQAASLLGVEPRGRLVEHQQVGLTEHRLGEDEASSLSARQRADPLRREVAEPGQLERPAYLSLPLIASDHSLRIAM